jgi:ribosomal protein S18 acetylase RimI-like enzyme
MLRDTVAVRFQNTWVTAFRFSRRNHIAMTPSIYAKAEDLPQLARSLASAFFEDPLFCWVFPDPSARPAHLERWMRLNLDIGFTRGHLYTVTENRGAAIWSPPNVQLFDPPALTQVVEVLSKLVGDGTQKVLEGFLRIVAVHPQDNPHFYLLLLGTHADYQNQGLGSRLIRPVLKRCDSQGLPAYLESTNARNIPFYQRQGFVQKGEVQVAPEGPSVYPMWRDPQ